MAYPILQTANTANSASAVSATTRTITLPSGLSSGDLIVIIYHGTDAAGPSATNITSNTGVWSVGSRGSLSGVSNRYAAFFKWSDGTESGLTETISQSNGTNILLSAASCYRITGADSSKTPVFQFLSGSTNSPSVTATWGGGENLFFSVVSHAQSGPPTLTSYPTGYSNGTNYRDAATALIAQSSKQSTAASDDAAAYSISYSGTRTFAMSFVVGAGAPPTIDSINGGNPVKVGQTGIPIALSNFISTPTSVTCTYASGTKSLTVSNIVGNNTAITVDLEDRSEGVDYPLLGSALEFTVTDGVGTDAISTTVAEKTGETDVTFQYVIDQYDTFFGYWFNADGFTSEGSEFIYTTSGFSPSDFVLNTDSGFSSTSGGVVTGWLRPATGTGAGNVYYYEFTINGGTITTSGSLTSSGLTSSGLTRVGLTSAGL